MEDEMDTNAANAEAKAEQLKLNFDELKKNFDELKTILLG